ncbi:rna-directed dna polymerase from mobile element jockey-like [Willisornis vidua]|uniref:Rna-directed dna polymerase from mobile element jockey-like n=1 Tax=Willisornis vidua TaxID=1566151 RepID=A0ABQ9D6P9_9PASS|nr:rna-directed dna polymerase from mobile element jockey-like [Willisornis vidua]
MICDNQHISLKGKTKPVAFYNGLVTSVEKGRAMDVISLGFYEGTECTLSKFADDTKQSSDTPEGQDAIPRDLDKLKKWGHVNLKRFNKVKCKMLHLSQGNAQYQYRIKGLREAQLRRTLEMLVD